MMPLQEGTLLLEYERSIDDELLARYQGGDFAGFDRFYQKNHALIFQFLLHRLCNRTDAEDAFQETFFRIHRFISSYDKNQKALAWVFTIARNVAIDTMNRRKHFVNIDVVPIPIEARTEEGLIAREELKTMLSKLTNEEKTLLEKRLLDDEGFDAIANDLATSNANVRQKLSRLLRKLRA